MRRAGRDRTAHRNRNRNRLLQVSAHSGRADHGPEPSVHDLGRHRPLGHPAPGHRESAHGLQAEHVEGQHQAAWQPGGGDKVAARQAGRVVVESLAGGDDEPGDASRAAVGDKALCAAPVVEHQRGIAQFKPFENFVHQPGDAEDRQIGARVHRPAVAAERKGGDYAAEVVPEPGDDMAPERTVHGDAVQQDNHGAVTAGVLVVDGPRRESQLGHEGPRLLS